ncbi:MAG: ParA family protein [Planctomycetia bacterium]|nr:ParA family protein [Planctomycetia bacterium]
MPATVICLINQKGGCGKSSTCFHLSGALAQTGRNVLLVDADPQGSLSQGFFGSAQVEMLRPEETLAGLFEDQRFLSEFHALSVPTAFERISMVRANQTLARHNVPAPEQAGLNQYVLRDFLSQLAGYDLVLIDCPPNLYQASWNALLAADFVAIPVPPEDFGTQGLRVVHQAIQHARVLNPSLELLGHVITRADRRLLVHRSYESRLRQHYQETVFTTVVPEASAFKVALTCRQPVTYHAPRSRAAEVTSQLAAELLSRVAAKTSKREAA